jgi:bifunctional DNA-binding transcriptional regulator/antitoxin component of YhaV-PrlF toxin-antitoxin module
MKQKLIKRVNVSPKRQITIPKEFFDQLKINNNRVQVYLDGDRMIVEPVAVEEYLFDFTEQLRTKLERDGYQGKRLADKLVEQRQMIDKAFGQLIKEAEAGYRSGNVVSHEELFADFNGEE